MANKKYTVQEIYDMKFQIVPDGFRPEEVNTFIDELNEQIGDQLEEIKTLNDSLESKTKEIERLKNENEKIKDELNELQTQDANEVKNTFSSKQVLKRLANIENKIGELIESNKGKNK